MHMLRFLKKNCDNSNRFGFPCPLLSCSVLFCPVLSCSVLFCPVLLCPVLSYVVLLLE